MSGEQHQRLPPLRTGIGRGVGLGAASLSLGAPRQRNGGTSEQPLAPSTAAASYAKDDAAVRSTDNDAIGSRIAAIHSGYIEDDVYTPLLGPSMPPAPRPPIINIGTHLRCQSIDRLMDSFLQENNKFKQIISLGAGSDSRYWRLQSDVRYRERIRQYIELDFPELTLAKIDKILKHKPLYSCISSMEGDLEITPERTSLFGKRYSLMACDLRTLSTSHSATEKLRSLLDPDVDTLILAECVLAYLTPTTSTSLLQHLATLVHQPYAVCYEMCIAGDAQIRDAEPSKFGKVMLSNLQARGLSMPGARAYATVASHAARFEFAFPKAGSTPEGRGTARLLAQVWAQLDDAERQRLSRLQGLDEVEELEMLLSHYAVGWYATKTDSNFLQTKLS